MKYTWLPFIASSLVLVAKYTSGTSICDGWYADPEVRMYNDTFWVFPTTSVPLSDQSSFDAWSSPDLATWKKHSNILDLNDIEWAVNQFWAPASIFRNGRYYLYFSANGLRTVSETAGIGVAVANAPEGPYTDALGKRLIDSLIHNANPMDPDILVDDDDQIYFYYGGTAVNVAMLNKDMVSFRQLPDEPNGTIFKDITPTPKFVEGTKVFKRNGRYYMMWSENGYGDPTYQVSYGMSDSPLGPFEVRGVVLQQRPKVAVATGHNSVLNIPGTDEWYVFYHRRATKEKDANKRTLAYDRMYFNADGTIEPIKITK